MVEFCNACGTSLPKGDLTIKAGKLYTSHDYNCPECRKVANPDKNKKAEAPEPDADKEIVIKDGKVSKE